MENMWKTWIWLSLVALTVVSGQQSNIPENAQTRIPPGLEECYRNRDIYERDNRLPMTMNTLIELIRKVEDYPGLNMDMRELSVALLHRFRQDGIEPAGDGVLYRPEVLPFSPKGFQFTRHRILLSRLLPGNAQRFPNETLSLIEQCSLHFAISSSIETQVRGDEGFRCNQLAQYRVNRVPRDIRQREPLIKNNFLGDVEMLKDIDLQAKRAGQIESFGEFDERENRTTLPPSWHRQYAPGGGNTFGVDISPNMISACPIENGVVRTKWGAVSAGTVLAGIAAGLQPQNVRVNDITPRKVPSGVGKAAQQSIIGTVDNRWVATLSGDLAEAALLQGPWYQVQVGAPGAWNSTIVPSWYFLSQKDRFQMTDAEIRGGIDGLLMAKNVADWRSKAGNLKLSQLLDLYYSPRGVFNEEHRACNRKALFPVVAPMNEMKDQTASFTSVLDKEMTIGVTLNDDAFLAFSADASESLSRYVPQSLNDLPCSVSNPIVGDSTVWRGASEVFVFVDTTWQFWEIQPVVADILEGIDVSRFGSNYTLLNAQDGRVMVESSNQLSDLYSNWNESLHRLHPAGFTLPNIIVQLKTLGANLLNLERQTNRLGGRSMTALLVSNRGSVEGDANYVLEQLQILREQVPDIRLIFLAPDQATRFAQFVTDERRDLYTFRPGGNGPGAENIQAQTTPVIQRLKEEPRRIVNPRCGAEWSADNEGNNQMPQFIEPKGIIFYRLHPNYFFRKRNDRKIRIQGSGYAQLTVCHSREVELPRQNVSNPNMQQGSMECRSIMTDTIEIDLTDPCGKTKVIHQCAPLYISVEGPQITESTNFRCNENDCRFADQAKFIIHQELLGCFSGVGKFMASLLFVALFSSLSLYRWF